MNAINPDTNGPVARVGQTTTADHPPQPSTTAAGGSVEATLAMLDRALRPLGREGRAQKLAISFGAFMSPEDHHD